LSSSEADQLVGKIDSALIQRLEEQCIEDGANQQRAKSCVSSILHFVVKQAIQLAPPYLNAQDLNALRKLANSLSKSASLMDESSTSSREFLGLISPSRQIFREDRTNISVAQLISYLSDFAEAITTELQQIESKRGRPVPVQLESISEFAAKKWIEATGQWPARTKSVDDGGPIHELFICIPIVLDQLPDPYCGLAIGVTERALLDAMGRFLKTNTNI
tara:strand:- start:58721 stop:59377 length:657 start_codon:yes stop_codon:yes gene_type:complete